MDSNYSDGYSGLAQAQLDKNDITGAIQSAKEAIAINTGNSTAHYALGEAYRRQGLLDEALKELNTALYQYRNSAPVHLATGNGHWHRKATLSAPSKNSRNQFASKLKILMLIWALPTSAKRAATSSIQLPNCAPV